MKKFHRKLTPATAFILILILILPICLCACSNSNITGSQAISFRQNNFTFNATVKTETKIYTLTGSYSTDGTAVLTFSAPPSLSGSTLLCRPDGQFLLSMPGGVNLPIPRQTLGGAALIYDFLTLDPSNFQGSAIQNEKLYANFTGDLTLILDPHSLSLKGALANGVSVDFTIN